MTSVDAPLETRQIATIEIPVVGMGTSGTFEIDPGDRVGVDERAAIVARALDLGATLFDSSPMYGRAEEVLAEALGTRRAGAIIATKVWTPDDELAEQQISASLAYNGGHVELFQIHNLVEWRTRLDQLERERDSGNIDLIGATHWKSEAFGELETVMRSGRIQFVQIPYNPVETEVEARILPTAAELGIGVLIMRPFARADLFARPPTAEQLAPLASFGVESWSQALLKWGLSDLRSTAAIPATSKLERVGANIAAGSAPWFDEDTRKYVAGLARA